MVKLCSTSSNRGIIVTCYEVFGNVNNKYHLKSYKRHSDQSVSTVNHVILIHSVISSPSPLYLLSYSYSPLINVPWKENPSCGSLVRSNFEAHMCFIQRHMQQTKNGMLLCVSESSQILNTFLSTQSNRISPPTQHNTANNACTTAIFLLRRQHIFCSESQLGNFIC